MIPSNETFVIAAYTLTWVVLLGYLGWLVRGSRRARAAFERAGGTR
jgi:hypothetical protein